MSLLAQVCFTHLPIDCAKSFANLLSPFSRRDHHHDATWVFRLKLGSMPLDLTLRIIIENPPPGVDYALQKGSGSAYETVQTQCSNGSNLIFEFTPSIRDGASDPMASLGGPYVQGPPRQRFVYLDIGTCAGQRDSPWSRRLKVPLAGITATMIAAGGIVETRVPGTGRDGGPTCATVKDFTGWKSVKR